MYSWTTLVECNLMNRTLQASFLPMPAVVLRGDWGLGTCSGPNGDPWPETRPSCAKKKEKSLLRNLNSQTKQQNTKQFQRKLKETGQNLTCTGWLYWCLVVGYSCGSFLFGYDWLGRLLCLRENMKTSRNLQSSVSFFTVIMHCLGMKLFFTRVGQNSKLRTGSEIRNRMIGR